MVLDAYTPVIFLLAVFIMVFAVSTMLGIENNFPVLLLLFGFTCLFCFISGVVDGLTMGVGIIALTGGFVLARRMKGGQVG